MLRRKLAGFLAAVMLITSVPANVWAEEVLPETEEIQLLSEAEENVSEQAAAPEINAETEAPEEVEPETEAPAETEAVTEPETKASAETEAVAQPETEAPTETEAVTEPETKAPVETEAVTEPETEAPAETEGMTEPITETPDKTEPATETITEALAEAEKETEVQTEAVIEESEQAADKTAEELSDVVCEKPDIKGEFRTGEEIVCTPKVSGGSGTYAYNYWLFDSTGTIVLSKENTFEDSWTFIAPEEGIYLLRVYATDFHSDSHSDTDWFAIEKAAEANAVQVSGVEVQGQMETGSRLTATATVKGGSGTYAYNYWLFDSTGTIVLSKENTFDASWTFEAPKGGTYLMRIYATDFATESYADSYWFAIEGNEVQVTDVKVEGEYKAGARLTVTPTVEGGSGSYAYNYWLFDSNGTIVLSHENTMDTSWSFVVPDGGTYLMRVYATDFATEHYADSSWFAVEFNNVKVGSVEVEDGIPSGETMRVTAQVSGGSGTYAYNYWVFDSTGNIVLRKENTFDAYADFVMPKEGGVYLVRVYATDFRTDDHSDSSWFYVVPSAENELAAPEIVFAGASWLTGKGAMVQWNHVEGAEKYVLYEVIDGEEVYLTYSQAAAAYIQNASFGPHTYRLRAAKRETDGSWTYGKASEASFVLYKFYDAEAPELYLRGEEGTISENVEWFSALPFTVGTSAVQEEIGGAVEVALQIDFTKDGTSIASAVETRTLTFASLEEKWEWFDQDVWEKAFEAGATEVKITLKPSADEEYFVSETEDSVAFLLAAKEESPLADIICTWPEVAEVGAPQKIVFTSRHPENLNEENGKVEVWQDGKLMWKKTLTQTHPSAELSFTVTDVNEKNIFTVSYMYGNYSVRHNICIKANELEELDFDSTYRVALGENGKFSPVFSDSENPFELEYTSSNPGVLQIISVKQEHVEYRAVGVGTAMITAKTLGGNAISVPVAVYDPQDTETPVIYLDTIQSEDAVGLDAFYLNVGTTTDQGKIGEDVSYMTPTLQLRFLDDANNCIAEDVGYMEINNDSFLLFTSVGHVFDSEILRWYYKGATKVEITLMPGDEEDGYLVSPDNQTVTLSLNVIEDLLNKEISPQLILDYPEYVYEGETAQIGIVCLNPRKLLKAHQIKLMHEEDILYEGTLTEENPKIIINQKISGVKDWDFSADSTTGYVTPGTIKVLGGEMPDEELWIDAGSKRLSPEFWYVDVEEPIRYESSNPEIASVDEDGWVTPKSVGTTVITATQGSVVLNCTVTVTAEPV